MKEFAVGEEIRIKCVESTMRVPNCFRCFFYGNCNTDVMVCQSFMRKDGKNVHFELVDEYDGNT